MAAALALKSQESKKKDNDNILPALHLPAFHHDALDQVGSRQAGPAWIEADQYEYESSDEDEEVVGNNIDHVGCGGTAPLVLTPPRSNRRSLYAKARTHPGVLTLFYHCLPVSHTL